MRIPVGRPLVTLAPREKSRRRSWKLKLARRPEGGVRREGEVEERLDIHVVSRLRFQFIGEGVRVWVRGAVRVGNAFARVDAKEQAGN